MSKEQLTGTIRINTKGTGFINTEDERTIQVFEDDLQTALNNDTVTVEVTGEKFYDNELAKVISIDKRKKMQFAGNVEKEGEKCIVKPDDQKMYRDIELDITECSKVQPGDKVFVEISWNDPVTLPQGKILQILGKKGENDAEMQAIVLDRGFDTSFPNAVQAEADTIKKEGHPLPEAEIAKRLDMRDRLTLTIDPFDAKDFDDALSLKYLDNGNMEIGVHIADVSHYVHRGTALDDEAFDRSFSVYLVDRTIPMLPEVLSNDLCSLKPHEDRFAFSAIFEMNENAEVLSRKFAKTIIHSDHRFSYEDAEDSLQDPEGTYHKELTTFNELAKKMQKRVFENGAINFAREEFKFELDNDGVPIRIYKKEPLQTHKLIEEFMLLANREVAKFIADFDKKQNAKEKGMMYRVHPQPDSDRIENLKPFLNALGYKLEINEDGSVSSPAINKVMEAAKGKPEEELVSTATIRTMSKALYSVKNDGHFGLAFDNYTHFTSPIRRYPDLVVHRILFAILEEQKLTDADTEFYKKVAEQSSAQEQSAQEAERNSIRYKQVEFMLGHIGKEFDGLISGVARFGLFIMDPETGTDGLIPIKELGQDYFNHDEKNFQLIGDKSGKKYRLGDTVKVKVVAADLDTLSIDLRLVDAN